MYIDNIDIGKIILAPMAGVTDVGFRSIARENGADFSYTEMVNANGLVHNPEKTKTLLYTEENERRSDHDTNSIDRPERRGQGLRGKAS